MNPIHTYLKQHLNSNEQDTIIREIRKIALENENSGYPIKDLLDALAYATKDADAAEYLSFNWHIDIPPTT